MVKVAVKVVVEVVVKFLVKVVAKVVANFVVNVEINFVESQSCEFFVVKNPGLWSILTLKV